MNHHSTISRPILWATLMLVVTVLSGCQAGSQADAIDVKAQYLDLPQRRVAVVVAMTDYAEFNYPNARELMTKEVARRIMVNVPDVRVTSPAEILAWQDTNPYWGTRPPAMLVEQLEVDRLILIEIGEYRTHEPGDRHVLRGIISANVNIVEAEATNPNNYGASYSVDVMYPRASDSKIGRVGISEDRIEKQTQLRFCEEAAGLFFDHTIVR